jgi:hypothetical protein
LISCRRFECLTKVRSPAGAGVCSIEDPFHDIEAGEEGAGTGELPRVRRKGSVVPSSAKISNLSLAELMGPVSLLNQLSFLNQLSMLSMLSFFNQLSEFNQ